MSHVFRNTVVQLTTPAGVVTTVSGTVADLLAGASTVVGNVTASWGAPDNKSHSDAGTAVLDVISREPVVYPFGTKIEVRTTWNMVAAGGDSGTNVPVFAGVIESQPYKRTRMTHPTTGAELQFWTTTLTCTDWVGRWAATKVGDIPWPEEPTFERVNRLRALAPDMISQAGSFPGSFNYQRPRDVDAQPALELFQRMVGDENLVHASRTGVVPVGYSGQVLDVRVPLWVPLFGVYNPVPVSADYVDDAPRSVGRDGHISQVQVRAWQEDPDNPFQAVERTFVFTSTSAGATPTAEHVIELDGMVYNDTPPSTLVRRAQAILSASAYPEPVLDQPVELLIGAGKVSRIRDLIALNPFDARDHRCAQTLEIDGCPPDLSAFQSVAAAELVIDPDPQALDRLTVTLVPFELAGGRVLTFAMIPDNSDATIGNVGDYMTIKRIGQPYILQED